MCVSRYCEVVLVVFALKSCSCMVHPFMSGRFLSKIFQRLYEIFVKVAASITIHIHTSNKMVSQEQKTNNQMKKVLSLIITHWNHDILFFLS